MDADLNAYRATKLLADATLAAGRIQAAATITAQILALRGTIPEDSREHIAYAMGVFESVEAELKKR